MTAKAQTLPYECIALVLQGGGALGAYQAGVFEGLADAGIVPDWVAGVSIGAINAALIAGNPPERRVERLREFWQTVTAPPLLPATPPAWLEAASQGQPMARTALGWFEASRALFEGQRGFFTPRVPSPIFSLDAAPDLLGHYDTAALAGTLERLVDFERLNDPRGMRLTVSAVNVRNGNDELFDNQRGPWAGRIGAAHILASGALPPGFAAVQIEGEYYWDGGLVSNTPLATVLDDEPRRDTLAFQVDLWSAIGPLPRNLLDVEERGKDIRYSSRTRAVTQQLERERQLRRVLREVLDKLPASARKGDAWCREAQALASDKRFNVVHLIYQEKEWDGQAKDYEFSARSMADHWASGLADLQRTLAHPDWLAPPGGHESTVTHDIHRHASGRP
ncbi:MAG: patatin-like phospholipase family protein [Pseudomonadota bacterium]